MAHICAAIVVLTTDFYFSLSHYRTNIPIDKGYLVYDHQRTADGHVPHAMVIVNYNTVMHYT